MFPALGFDDFLGGQLVVGVVENVIEGLRWSYPYGEGRLVSEELGVRECVYG
jgi:hypothetical protein